MKRCFSFGLFLVLSSVGSLFATPSLRLTEVSVTRFVLDESGQDQLERGWINLWGEFELENRQRVLSTVSVPPAARNQNLVTREAVVAYRRLAPQAMANFVFDETGDFYVVGAREYLPISAAPDAKSDVGKLLNLSTRGSVKPGSPLISGLVISDYPRRVLIRVVGPGLKEFGVEHPAEDPELLLFHGETHQANNDDWYLGANGEQISILSASVGAFALKPQSKDAAYTAVLPPGTYTVHASAKATGEVLLEVYLLP